MAEVVATAHDADEAAHSVTTDTGGDDIAVGLRLGEYHVHGWDAVLHLRYHLRQTEVSVRTAHQVGMMVLDEVVLDAFSHTSEDTKERTRAALAVLLSAFRDTLVLSFCPVAVRAVPFQSCVMVLLGKQLVQTMVNLVLRILTDRTCVKEHRVGVLLIVGGFIACHLHDAGHNL